MVVVVVAFAVPVAVAVALPLALGVVGMVSSRTVSWRGLCRPRACHRESLDCSTADLTSSLAALLPSAAPAPSTREEGKLHPQRNLPPSGVDRPNLPPAREPMCARRADGVRKAERAREGRRPLQLGPRATANAGARRQRGREKCTLSENLPPSDADLSELPPARTAAAAETPSRADSRCCQLPPARTAAAALPQTGRGPEAASPACANTGPHLPRRMTMGTVGA